MNKDHFEELVKRVIDDVPGTIIETVYGETSKKQHYSLIINKVLWYALRLVLEVDERVGECVYLEKLSEHLTLEGVKTRCSEIKKGFDLDIPLHPKYKRVEGQVLDFIFSQDVPKGVVNDPDRYLKPGDHIGISRGLYNHEAIYLGSRKVIQVPNTTDAIREDAWETFLGDNPKGIYFYTYLIRTKTVDEILNTAKSFIGKRGNEYNLFTKNCQHFSSFCHTGVEFSNDFNHEEIKLEKNKKGTFCYMRIVTRSTMPLR